MRLEFWNDFLVFVSLILSILLIFLSFRFIIVTHIWAFAPRVGSKFQLFLDSSPSKCILEGGVAVRANKIELAFSQGSQGFEDQLDVGAEAAGCVW